jgi:hypothetical protein
MYNLYSLRFNYLTRIFYHLLAKSCFVKPCAFFSAREKLIMVNYVSLTYMLVVINIHDLVGCGLLTGKNVGLTPCLVQ